MGSDLSSRWSAAEEVLSTLTGHRQRTAVPPRSWNETAGGNAQVGSDLSSRWSAETRRSFFCNLRFNLHLSARFRCQQAADQGAAFMQIVSAATRRVARMFCVARGARLAVFAVAAVGLAGCQDKYEWHQKLTVVVSTPSGKVSGSSVIAINARYGQVPLSDIEVWYDVTGEATVVEVAPGRYLFALLEGTEERLYRSIREQSEYRSRGDWLKIIPALKDTVKINKKDIQSF